MRPIAQPIESQPNTTPNLEDLFIPIDLDISFDVAVTRTQHIVFVDQLIKFGGLIGILIALKYLLLPICAVFFVQHFKEFLIRKSQQKLRLMHIKDVVRHAPALREIISKKIEACEGQMKGAHEIEEMEADL